MKPSCLVLLLATGCYLEGGTDEELTVFSLDPDVGITGMYAKDDVAVFFETVRVVVPDADVDHSLYASDGTPIAISTRWVDMEGSPLVVDIGNEGAPASWGDGIEEAKIMTPERHELRQRSLDLVIRARDVLDGYDQIASVEQQQLVATSHFVSPRNGRFAELADSAIVDGESTQTTTRQFFEIRADPPHQSSWWQNQYYSGGWWHHSYVSNWNHGRRTARDEAWVNCNKVTGSRTYYITGSITCTTPYSMVGTSGHNCRSDSQLQQDYVVDRSWNRNWHCNAPRVIPAVCN